MNTHKGSKRILSVTVKRIIDEDGDTSWLGEYSDDPGDFAIVNHGQYEGEFVSDLPCECEHDEAGHYGENAETDGPCQIDGCDCEEFDRVGVERGRSYRYFNSASVESSNPDEDNRTYAIQDYERMRGLNDGDWCFVGVRADARVQLNGDLCQDITSGGLWGIESDSGDYFKEVEAEELAELRDQLEAIGFSKRAVTAAFRNVEHEDE